MKSTGLAYILWFFLGFAGAHKFYLMRNPSGILYALLHFIGWALSGILVGYVFLGIWLVLWLLDIFLIPRHTRIANERITDMLRKDLRS